MTFTIRDILELLVLPIMGYGVYILRDLNQSVNQLNIQMAVVLTNHGHTEKEMIELKGRVTKLEEGL